MSTYKRHQFPPDIISYAVWLYYRFNLSHGDIEDSRPTISYIFHRLISPAERHAAMTWAQRLKRAFKIDIEVCGRCGGSVKVIVDTSNCCIEDQGVIDKVNRSVASREGALGYITSFRWEAIPVQHH